MVTDFYCYSLLIHIFLLMMKEKKSHILIGYAFWKKRHIITSYLLIYSFIIFRYARSIFIQLSGQDLLPILQTSFTSMLLVCIQQPSQCNRIRVPFSFLCWFAGTAQVINNEFFLRDQNIPTTKNLIQKRLIQSIRISI